ncbi:hypothetical protein TNCV_475761 [Trichonephila clavipes]|nr:hypothetical protein TNCV_475761 [Trichonephila clavipes]
MTNMTHLGYYYILLSNPQSTISSERINMCNIYEGLKPIVFLYLPSCDVTTFQQANIIPIPVDDVRDQKRIVLLPEIVRDKGFLESIPHGFGDRLRQRTRMETGSRAESKHVI